MKFIENTLYDTKRLIVLDVLTIDRIKMAFTEGEIMNGIQKIGFTHAIITHKTVDLLRKNGLKGGVILEIDQR